jgi:hypothetical protein
VRVVSMGSNIGRFWPRSLGRYFFADSGLIYDSGAGGPHDVDLSR